jgi:hypothetical protein
MGVQAITDDELTLVAEVARREGWDDLARPPESHAPRSLGEERAVARFAEAVPRRARRTATLEMRARVGLVALAVVVLGVCWWVSPTRTAIGLVGAGIFCLWSLRRSRRRARGGRAPAPARSGWRRLSA